VAQRNWRVAERSRELYRWDQRSQDAPQWTGQVAKPIARRVIEVLMPQVRHSFPSIGETLIYTAEDDR